MAAEFDPDRKGFRFRFIVRGDAKRERLQMVEAVAFFPVRTNQIPTFNLAKLEKTRRLVPFEESSA